MMVHGSLAFPPALWFACSRELAINSCRWGGHHSGYITESGDAGQGLEAKVGEVGGDYVQLEQTILHMTSMLW